MAVAQVVLPCVDLDGTIHWFTENAGFRLLLISPADDPSVALLEGHDLRIYLDRSEPAGNIKLRIPTEGEPRDTITGPNGSTIEFVSSSAELTLPPNEPAFVHDSLADAAWGTGRAGMEYRDLIPNRQGGRFIASHVRILEGGPVPDYVHHHHIRFQMIFCHRGWATLVYEDQGEPFRFEAGDCVLQPPHIRHQVLETSDEFEVVEIGSPAVHDTLRDHEMELPTGTIDRDRVFGGQRFVHHVGVNETWGDWHADGFSSASFGIDVATNELADVRLVRTSVTPKDLTFKPTEEFVFWFIRQGQFTLWRGEEQFQVQQRDGLVLAAGEHYRMTEIGDDVEFLEVRVL